MLIVLLLISSLLLIWIFSELLVGVERVGEEIKNSSPSFKHLPKAKRVRRIYGQTITAYNTVPSQTSGDPCLAADGTNICNTNNSIACPRDIPYGMHVAIRGMDYICHDRLNKKFEGRWDICFGKDIKKAKKFGKKIRTVTIYLD